MAAASASSVSLSGTLVPSSVATASSRLRPSWRTDGAGKGVVDGDVSYARSTITWYRDSFFRPQMQQAVSAEIPLWVELGSALALASTLSFVFGLSQPPLEHSTYEAQSSPSMSVHPNLSSLSLHPPHYTQVT